MSNGTTDNTDTRLTNKMASTVIKLMSIQNNILLPVFAWMKQYTFTFKFYHKQ